jgi:hypothetical protein
MTDKMTESDKPKPTREELEYRARQLSMFLVGYAYGMLSRLWKELPPELLEKHASDYEWFCEHAERLHNLNAQAETASREPS